MNWGIVVLTVQREKSKGVKEGLAGLRVEID